MMNRETSFIVSQGFEPPPAESCSIAYSALRIQPRIIGALVIIAAVLQSVPLFLAMGIVLFWNALLPRWNPVDALYNRFFAARSAFRLQPAPPPRRFAQFLAGVLSVGSGIALLLGSRVVAFACAAVLLAAVLAIVFRGFCFGSFIYHRLRPRKSPPEVAPAEQ